MGEIKPITVLGTRKRCDEVLHLPIQFARILQSLSHLAADHFRVAHTSYLTHCREEVTRKNALFSSRRWKETGNLRPTRITTSTAYQ